MDNIGDQWERLQTDPLAPVSAFFDNFIANCQAHFNFTPGPYTCIDEMLLAFKCRSNFFIYMPNKPAKYGINTYNAMSDIAGRQLTYPISHTKYLKLTKNQFFVLLLVLLNMNF